MDGAGTADLVYLHGENAQLYFNQSGNGFTAAHSLEQGFPRLDTLASTVEQQNKTVKPEPAATGWSFFRRAST